MPEASCEAVIVIADGVYALIVATPPLILIASELDVKVYAPLLLLIPDITSVNENDTSTPKVFDTCEMDWYVGVPRLTSTVIAVLPLA